MKRLGVAVVVVGLVAGCSGVGEGPLGQGDGGVSMCMPLTKGQPDVTFGPDVLRNRGHEEATVTGVSVVDAVGLRVVDALIVPVGLGDSLVGLKRGWAPRGQPAVGYAVAADGKAHNLVLHLVRDDELAEETGLRGVRVDYAVGERSYRMVFTTRLTLTSTRC
ncbi:hypothetical protein GCM10009745_25840 [Kribbella yunnanensis]|uniref:Uncharacterized protein n=1 Tax=Kribbella yunnanensis TaxID=190194 RepID=A0ABP4T2G3_9ACTN